MTIQLGWPQAIYIAITLLGLILAAKDHGKPREPSSFWTQLIGSGITYVLLIWGGFFR